MLRTPLAVLRRASTCPRLMDVAKRLRTRTTRLNSVESGRSVASDDFLSRLAKALELPAEMVVAAYLEGRRLHLESEARAVRARLMDIRSEGRKRRTA